MHTPSLGRTTQHARRCLIDFHHSAMRPCGLATTSWLDIAAHQTVRRHSVPHPGSPAVCPPGSQDCQLRMGKIRREARRGTRGYKSSGKGATQLGNTIDTTAHTPAAFPPSSHLCGNSKRDKSTKLRDRTRSSEARMGPAGNLSSTEICKPPPAAARCWLSFSLSHNPVPHILSHPRSLLFLSCVY